MFLPPTDAPNIVPTPKNASAIALNRLKLINRRFIQSAN